MQLLLDNHAKESLTVYSDEFRACDLLEDDENYEQKGIIHGEGDVDGDAHVNTCEGHASLSRRWLSPHRGISKDSLLLYLRAFHIRCHIFHNPSLEPLKNIVGTIL